jgi:hypothetical protein
MKLHARSKRSALPVAKLALEKALAQLVIASNAASLSGEAQIATTIIDATKRLRGVAATIHPHRNGVH